MILHTYVTGEGDPFVFLHSGGMTGATEYEEQRDFFIKRNDLVIRPDLRGHGKSVGTIDGNYFGHCVKDLADTLKALNVTQCHLAGVSLGGIVGLLFAKEFPEMVKSLSFSSIFPVKPDDWDEQMRQELERYRQLFDSDEVVSFMDKIHGKNDWTSLLVRFCDDDFYPV